MISASSGNPIPAAQVTILGTTNGTTTDGNGRFRFNGLAAGPYELRVEAPRFAVAVQRMELSVGQALDVPQEGGKLCRGHAGGLRSWGSRK